MPFNNNVVVDPLWRPQMNWNGHAITQLRFFAYVQGSQAGRPADDEEQEMVEWGAEMETNRE